MEVHSHEHLATCPRKLYAPFPLHALWSLLFAPMYAYNEKTSHYKKQKRRQSGNKVERHLIIIMIIII